MVYREKDLNNPPAGLTDPKWDTLKFNLLREKSDHKVKSTCYRDTTLGDLTLLYKNKCAICERKRGFELQVDHYRPKKPRENQTAQKYNHPGYYWLAYEWSNFIPLCSKCNGNKSNKFPLKGWSHVNRISDHENINELNPFEPYCRDWLHFKESPLFINPEVEKQPERHFKYLPDCRIEGQTEEGKETIEICKLNRRDLLRERLEILNRYVKDIQDLLDEYIISKNDLELNGGLKVVFRGIKARTHKDEEYSLFHTFIYHYFNDFILKKLPSNTRVIISQYFIDFKNT